VKRESSESILCYSTREAGLASILVSCSSTPSWLPIKSSLQKVISSHHVFTHHCIFLFSRRGVAVFCCFASVLRAANKEDSSVLRSCLQFSRVGRCETLTFCTECTYLVILLILTTGGQFYQIRNIHLVCRSFTQYLSIMSGALNI
jgi:hypothetical protein